MSSGNPYYVGLQNVGSYQVSGIPFVSGSITVTKLAAPIEIRFPEVTKRIIISCKNGSNDTRVGFSANGVQNSNHFTLNAGTTVASRLVLDVKVSSIFLYCPSGGAASATVDIAAELTNIDTSLLELSGPSGSNWSGSVGVG